MAEEAGFHSVAVIDKMNYDLWDPLPTLAAAAAVTTKVRLVSAILQLPNRNFVEVAKQAAVVDQISAGRLNLGVGIGGHYDDYEVVGAAFENRGDRLASHVAGIRSVWSNAAEATASSSRCGPAPVQRPGPPIWIGAWQLKAVDRAVKIGDGFITGIGTFDRVINLAHYARQVADECGRVNFTTVAVMYVAVTDGRVSASNEAIDSIRRYYGPESDRMDSVVVGPVSAVAEAIGELAAGGFNEVILLPLVADLGQVEALAEVV